MPKSRKPVQPVQAEKPAVPVVQTAPIANTAGLTVVYDKIEINEYSTTSSKGPLTIEMQKMLLGWETESEFKERKCREVTGSKPDQWAWGSDMVEFTDEIGQKVNVPVHCKNVAGEKVICKHNAHNRPFDEKWCQSLIHTILYGQWAGPHTIPGETVNGETIRVSRYGRVLSGQHSMTACILAGEWLHQARKADADPPDNPKYPAWRKEGNPFLETIVITGMSEDPRVLMTVDYVKPRTAADVFYTSEVFKSATPPERKELCRILASAVDMLWTRTSARGYRTHPEAVGFLERHKKLLDCSLHLFEENSPKSGRKISRLRLQPGTCAALCYLMASSGPQTDGDVYRNEMPPTEKNLDWSLWDKATEFWTLLADGVDFQPVRDALGRLVDSSEGNDTNQGLGGRGPEKLAILDRAWAIWKECTGGDPFTNDDVAPGGALCLSYSDLDDTGEKLPDNQIKLIDVADFLGIDSPEVIKSSSVSRSQPPDPVVSEGEVQEAIENTKKRRLAAAK